MLMPKAISSGAMAMFSARTRTLDLGPSLTAISSFWTSRISYTITATKPREPAITTVVTVDTVVVVTVETIKRLLASCS